MSRRRKKGRHHGSGNNKPPQKQQQQQKKSAYSCRYIVPLAEWQRFERFKSYFSQIEDAVSDLQESWNSYLDYLVTEFNINLDETESMHDVIRRLGDLMKGIDMPTQKSRRHSYYEQKQYDRPIDKVNYRPKIANMIAEILIEDISDGKL